MSDAQLFVIAMFDDQYRDTIHFLSTGYAPNEFTTTAKKKLVATAADFHLIAGHLYKMGPDEILQCCVL